MDDGLRQIGMSWADSITAIVVIAIGALAIAAVVYWARKWSLVRQERAWMLRRVIIPARIKANMPQTMWRSYADRRRHPRRHGHPVSVGLYSGSEKRFGDGRLIDRSTGGVCVMTNLHLPVGSVVTIHPHGHSTTLPGVSVEVRSSRPDIAFWRLGCMFMHRPSWSVLMHLR